MATNVVMPQMGESIAEGTIVRWIKKVGENVDRDEPLFEISTDKVDAEIPSPGAGVLTEIKVKEGETVPVNSVVAVIGGDTAADLPPKGGSHEIASGAAGSELPEAAVGQPETAAAGPESELPEAVAGQSETPSAFAAPAASTFAAGAATADRSAGQPTQEDLRRLKSSPLVRRIAKEHNVDIRQINGTGISGRVTKNDILGFIETGPSSAASTSAPAGGSTFAASTSAPVGASVDKDAATEGKLERPAAAPAARQIGHVPAYKPGDKVEIVPMTIMRKKIAEHMVISAHTSPHVYSVYEVDFHRLSQMRDKKKAEYERNGAKLSFTVLIAKVVVDALRAFPLVNASIDGDNIVYKKDINLGIAVALDQGLIVPVIRNADEKNLVGLSRAIEDLAARARSKKLNPEEVQAGTFTITNPGVFGAVYGLPLINQPQVAILGVGTIEKRPIVIDDAIGIRTMAYLTLGYDHRLVDGAVADQFMADVKDHLENFDASQV
jgi:2-oxoglutarate dehydrogenase E2 component (dihydrolipoamide succinyltransferase)